MLNTNKWMRKLSVVAGMLFLTVCAQAFMLDAQITIDRALNSPTLTVRYNGATAVMVELRVNGASVGTRAVTGRNTGETNFTLDLSSLNDGDNNVEVRLIDKDGKIVGTQKATITADAGTNSPVFLSSPKVGATVRGPVEIKVGFGKEMKNSYVSFFINNQFKSMTNYPPFSYVWDTTGETNGWHEVEAWIVDDNSNTFKTKKTRVFVNNPGGRTERPVTTAQPAVKTPLVAVKIPAVKAPVMGIVKAPMTSVKLSGSVSGLKPAIMTKGLATGPKSMTPLAVKVVKATTPAKVIKNASTSGTAVVTQSASSINAAAGTIRITKGQRVPNLGPLIIVMNSSYLNFDVAPRVTNGIPLTPFRHLIEKAGGEVKWETFKKSLTANADGRDIFLKIGDKIGKINNRSIELELAPFLERGRTIVPLSFINESLNVDVEYDKATGHVLITKKKN